MSHQLRQAGRASVHNGHGARPRQQSASVPPLRLRGGTGGVGSQAVNAGGGSRGGATQGTQFIKVSQPAPVASAAAAAPYHHQYLPAPATTAATALPLPLPLLLVVRRVLADTGPEHMATGMASTMCSPRGPGTPTPPVSCRRRSRYDRR